MAGDNACGRALGGDGVEWVFHIADAVAPALAAFLAFAVAHVDQVGGDKAHGIAGIEALVVQS